MYDMAWRTLGLMESSVTRQGVDKVAGKDARRERREMHSVRTVHCDMCRLQGRRRGYCRIAAVKEEYRQASGEVTGGVVVVAGEPRRSARAETWSRADAVRCLG